MDYIKNFVSIESENDRIKRKNLHLASALIAFVWMVFHFTVVYFFGLELDSAVLVGIFLGVGNVIALLMDVPVGILQRYFKAKTLYMFGACSMLISGLIFMKFIYFAQTIESSGEIINSIIAFFVNDVFNLLLLVIASLLYGFTKEVNDVTTLSYILNNSDPSEYSSIISKNNIYTGIGSLLGLLASWVILTWNTVIAVITLNVIIVLLMLFILKYFDNHKETVNISDIQKLKVVIEKENIEKIKEYTIMQVKKADFLEIAKKSRFIFLKPLQVQGKINKKELIEGTKKEFQSIHHTLSTPFNISLAWLIMIVLCFGFWDTFAATFLIDFLKKYQFAYILLGIIAIPAFVMQEFFIKLSKKIGVFPIIGFGVAVSGISILMLGILADPTNSSTVWYILGLGVINSLGYAAAMALSQGAFLDGYNSDYANKYNLKEINSNASAAPLKMIQNLANVVGLVLGGFFVSIFWYQGFFIVFGFFLMIVLTVTMMRKEGLDV